MNIPQDVLIIGGIAVLAVVVVYVIISVFYRKARFLDSEPTGQKPVWMETDPPDESQAATQAHGQGIALYHHQAGEKLAAPFAEQIEDIVHARLNEYPDLAAMQIDFGAAPDGGLEIWVDGTCYTSIEALPHPELRQVIQKAIEQWDRK